MINSTNIKNLIISGIFLFILLVSNSCISEQPVKIDNGEEKFTQELFLNPPKEACPQVWWWWLQTNTNKAAITHDLEEMKAKGISGCLILDGGVAPFGPRKWTQKTIIGETEIIYENTNEYEGSSLTQAPAGMVQWSKEWRDIVRFASKEAGRLNLDLGVFIGPAGCAAPWVTPEYGQQELVWNETTVNELSTNIVLDKPVFGKIKNPRLKPEDIKNLSTYYNDVAILAVPKKEKVDLEEVIDISEYINKNGLLSWDIPRGEWTIYRFGYRPTGQNLAGVYYIDHLSAEVFNKHWENTVAKLLNEMSPEERVAFKYVECDSWEAGNPNWTKLFPEEFQKRRGYNMIRRLPVLAGCNIGDDSESVGFQNDYRQTISDLITDNHYKRQKEVANANNLDSYAEAAGPHQFQADIFKCVGNCDVAMGEFWMPSPHRPTPPARFLVRDAATAAHIYGIKKVFAESFTSVGPNWEESPFLMKSSADQAFCDGLNWICFHTFSHRPSLSDKPGFTHSAGTHFDPTITWWDQSGPFVDYLSRCSYMLQQGLFVADVLFYKGDGIRSTGNQTSKNAFYLEDGLKNPPPSLGKGYDYDQCNEDVLLNRLSVKDGMLFLPDGMSYRLLALNPQIPVSLVALQKIKALVEAGATVVVEPPVPWLGSNDKLEDFKVLVEQLWGEGNNSIRRIGKGRVISNVALKEVLKNDGILPDFECHGVSESGVIDYIHRKVNNSDIYFVASRWQPVEEVEAIFRVSGKQPELWNPVTGEVRELTNFKQEKGRTIIPLQFEPCGSFFVVFKDSIRNSSKQKNWLEYTEIAQLSNEWKVQFDTAWGGPNEIVFKQLYDWSESSIEGVKYYSGKATYQTTFDNPSRTNGELCFLDLGTVHEVAAVRLNDVDLGILWTRPFRVEISSALKAENNKLEIEVVNLWPNRLVGDEFLPSNQRFTKTNIRKFTKTSELLPSGLLGPVKLVKVNKSRNKKYE